MSETRAERGIEPAEARRALADGVERLARGDEAGALASLRRAQRAREPGVSASARLAIGRLMAARGKWSSAERAIKRAAETDRAPDELRRLAWQTLAWVRAERRDERGAEEAERAAEALGQGPTW